MKPRLRRAATLKTLDRTAEALEGFRKVLLLEPDCQEARRGVQVILRDPAVLVARLSRADVLKTQGRLTEAEEAYRAVLQLQPDSQKATDGLVEIDRRKQEYEDVVEVEPGCQEANKDQLERGDRNVSSLGICNHFRRRRGGKKIQKVTKCLHCCLGKKSNINTLPQLIPCLILISLYW